MLVAQCRHLMWSPVVSSAWLGRRCAASQGATPDCGTRDYYKLLGLERGCSKADVKQAYYRLVRELHPDASGHDPDAGSSARFSEVTTAYRTLTDDTKRRMYDSGGVPNAEQDPTAPGAPNPFGSAGTDAGGAFSVFESALLKEGGMADVLVAGAGSVLRGILGSLGLRRLWERDQQQEAGTSSPRHKGAPVPVEIDFMDSLRGCKVQVKRPRHVGSESLTVEIPAGTVDGEVVAALTPKGKEQYVVVKVRPHDVFRVEGGDLHVDVPVSVGRAVAGGSVRVPLPFERIPMAIQVKPGTQSGDTVHVYGRGMRRKNSVGRGDLVLHLNVVVPDIRKLPKEQRDLIMRYDELSRDDNNSS